jgi:hypothetical protein
MCGITKNKLSSIVLELENHKTCLFVPYMAPNRSSQWQVFWLISERDLVLISAPKRPVLKKTSLTQLSIHVLQIYRIGTDEMFRLVHIKPSSGLSHNNM